jgi:hypothetical protein
MALDMGAVFDERLFCSGVTRGVSLQDAVVFRLAGFLSHHLQSVDAGRVHPLRNFT